MRRFVFLISTLFALQANSQSLIYDFRQTQVGNYLPADLTTDRTAVLVSAEPRQMDYLVDGSWRALSEKVHTGFQKMGIDAVAYLNHRDYLSGNSSRSHYSSLLTKRGVKNLIFVTEREGAFELLCTPYNKKESLLDFGQQAYRRKAQSLNQLLLEFARDIKRADLVQQNFLIPERPSFLNAISIVENANLSRYPGQVRRSKLAIERFKKITVPKDASEETIGRIEKYNSEVDKNNLELEAILEELPYDLAFIEHMSDENLLRNRYQFVLRNLYASGESIKAMLKYKDEQSDAGYVSVIPIMPDNTSIKTLPRNALVYKFYIRQNIAKNVYVGEWDADEKWQDALRNYIRNMIQFFNKGN